ncbi:ppg3, putative [Babesia caballi]|uniref:Ppg3, putative n=1 Tax=Babesia caballi TaxID=5871 RepID=A0AAV4M0Y5_BABCB|nr:ppg3, putative [Babesia caballi]
MRGSTYHLGDDAVRHVERLVLDELRLLGVELERADGRLDVVGVNDEQLVEALLDRLVTLGVDEDELVAVLPGKLVQPRHVDAPVEVLVLGVDVNDGLVRAQHVLQHEGVRAVDGRNQLAEEELAHLLGVAHVAPVEVDRVQHVAVTRNHQRLRLHGVHVLHGIYPRCTRDSPVGRA